MADARVIIVGAGIGGLSAAVMLAAKGTAVTVFERAATPGGKMREVPVGNRLIDGGPTVFTMRWVFDELLAMAGRSLDAELDLAPATILARHAWSDTERLDLYADIDRSAEEIAAFAGPDEGRAYKEFCTRARRHYEALEGPFMRASRPNMVSLFTRVGFAGLPGLMEVSPFETLWHALGRTFADPRLQQLFGRFSTYMGSSPFRAPATLMLIAHVEQSGVWYVKGGMRRIADALERVATESGAAFHYDSAVAEITTANGRANGVVLANGARHEADAVIVNGDASAVGMGLFGADVHGAVDPVVPKDRSLSAMAWTMVAEPKGFPLIRHSVFFNRDYRDEFEAPFSRRTITNEPTVYICAQDRDDETPQPDSPERLLILVNAPADGDTHTYTDQEKAQCTEHMLAQLARCGVSLTPDPDQTVITAPSDFNHLFPGSGGAIYGRASHGWQASFQRPGSKTRVPGLYLAGGTVHPGAGVPMASLSGRLAAESLLQDFAST